MVAAFISRFLARVRAPGSISSTIRAFARDGAWADDDCSLAEARTEAARCRALVKDKIDPIEARKEARRIVTATTLHAGVVTWIRC